MIGAGACLAGVDGLDGAGVAMFFTGNAGLAWVLAFFAGVDGLEAAGVACCAFVRC